MKRIPRNDIKSKVQKIAKQYNDRIYYYRRKGISDTPKTVKPSNLLRYYSGDNNALMKRLQQLKDYTYVNAKEKIKVGKYKANINKYRYEKFSENKDYAITKLKEDIRKSKMRDRKEGYRLDSERTRSLTARLQTIQYGSKQNATKKQIEAAMKYTGYYTEQRITMDEQFYDNFMQMFTTQAKLSGVPDDVLADIRNNFEKLSPDDLLEMFENEPDVKQIVNNYNLTKDVGKDFFTKKERTKEYNKFVALKDYLPTIIERYKK